MTSPDFRIWKYELPLTAPVSLKPGVDMDVREGLLLEITDEDGRSFWGEAAPLPGFSPENLDDARRDLEEKIVKLRRVDLRLRNSDAVSGSLSSGSPSVEFAVASAFAGLASETSPKPGDAPAGSLPDFGGLAHLEPHGSPEHSIAVCGLLSGSRAEILADAENLRESGYEAVKLKVGRGEVGDDAALVREVRAVLGENASLRLDANRAWTFDEAGMFARRIEDANVEFVEEPLGDASRLRELSEKTGLPVALDESLAGVGFGDAEAHEYARAFVLKPTVIGFSRTMRIAEAARSIGGKAIISSAYESGIGTLALLRMAATFGRGAAGLDTYRRLADDVICPSLDLSKPRVDLRGTFGKPRKVDYEKLERVE